MYPRGCKLYYIAGKHSERLTSQKRNAVHCKLTILHLKHRRLDQQWRKVQTNGLFSILFVQYINISIPSIRDLIRAKYLL